MTKIFRTILVVEDSSEDRELYRRYLKHRSDRSYRILEASRGEEGLTLWQQHQPDITLLDYSLPDLDGLEFLAQLRSPIQHPYLPVIVVTGQGSETIAVQAMKAGAQDYLVKGQITPEGFHCAIEHAIETVQLQQCIERERITAQITQKIHQTLDLEEILQTTVTEVRRFLQTDRVLIFRLQSEGWGTVTVESVGPGWMSLLSTEYCDSGFINADCVVPLSQGLAVCNSDINDGIADPHQAGFLTNLQVRASLIAPILQNQRLWGMLIAHHCTAPRQWKPTEIDLLKELATQVGIAVKQAELYQQVQNQVQEQKHVADQLRTSEERLRSALEASRMGTWDWDIQSGQIQWSDNLEAQFGLAPGEFDGSFEMFINRVHPDDRDRVLAAIDHTLKTGEEYSLEFRIIYPNGNIRWTLAQGNVFYNRQGNPIRMAGNDVDITERKQIEQDLQSSEALFRTSVETMLDCFAIYQSVRNAQGEIFDFQAVYINDAACVVSQLSREQHLGQGLCELLPGHRDNGLFDEYCQVVKTGQPLVKESLIYSDFGEQRLIKAFDIRVTKFGDGYIATWRDICDRKRTEEALRQKEELLRLALEGAQAGSWSWEIPTGKISWSPENFVLYGLAPIENAPQYEDWYNALHPDDREWTNAEVLRVVEQRLPEFRAEFRIIHPQHGIRWLLGLGRLTFDDQGNPIRLSGINLDISDRKQTEVNLKQTTERLDLALKSAPITLFNQDCNLRYTWVYNPTHCYSIEEVIGQRDEDLASPDSAAYLTHLKRQVLLTGNSLREEVKVINLRGETAYYDLTLDPLRNHHNEVEGITGAAVNISDRKQLQAERERLLQQEQAARERAEHANRVKDEFLAVLSHELRSPLNPILGWAKLLQTRSFDAKRTAEALATIERNAKLQTQLIDDLLDIARILRGKLKMEAQPVDLAFVIEAAIDTVNATALAKDILIHPVLPSIGRVSGDAIRLQQVIWNLLSNAIKFTPRGGQVSIRLEKIDQQAQITVSDTGKGIHPDFLPHIFESFRQEDASVTRNYGGLGLGLAIVRYLVEAHGGTIWVESEGDGKGATFTIQLPLLDAESDSIDPQEITLSHPLDLSGIRILVIDDEPDTRILLTIMLTHDGAEVLSLKGPAEVVATLESFQPNILISDISMPQIDGYTLIQQIRALPPDKGGQIPAIALTAYAREEDAQRALASGFQRHITKPLDPVILASIILDLVNQPMT